MEITGTFSGSLNVEPEEIARFFNALTPETREQCFNLALKAYPQLIGEFVKAALPHQANAQLPNLFWWLPQTPQR